MELEGPEEALSVGKQDHLSTLEPIITSTRRKFIRFDLLESLPLEFLSYNFHPLYIDTSKEEEVNHLEAEKSVSLEKFPPEHLAKIKIPTIVPTFTHGYIFKFDAGGQIIQPLEIADPALLLVLNGGFELNINDDITPNLLMGDTFGMFLHEGDLLQIKNLNEVGESYFVLLEMENPPSEPTALRGSKSKLSAELLSKGNTNKLNQTAFPLSEPETKSKLGNSNKINANQPFSNEPEYQSLSQQNDSHCTEVPMEQEMEMASSPTATSRPRPILRGVRKILDAFGF